jgi:hypothetical protein
VLEKTSMVRLPHTRRGSLVTGSSCSLSCAPSPPPRHLSPRHLSPSGSVFSTRNSEMSHEQCKMMMLGGIGRR